MATRPSSAASLTRWASPPERVVLDWPEGDVAEPGLAERFERPGDLGDVVEEGPGLVDPHLQDVADRLPLEAAFERLGVVAKPLARLAADVKVGQEVHLDLADALALAGLAPAPLDVEAEPAGGVAPDLGLAGPGEDLADLVEDAGEGGRGRPRPPADRRLVDRDQLVDRLQAVDPLVGPGPRALPLQVPAGGPGEDVVDQGALARPAHARSRRSGCRAGSTRRRP